MAVAMHTAWRSFVKFHLFRDEPDWLQASVALQNRTFEIVKFLDTLNWAGATKHIPEYGADFLYENWARSLHEWVTSGSRPWSDLREQEQREYQVMVETFVTMSNVFPQI